MEEFELEQLRRHAKWTSILEVYQRLSLESRQQLLPGFDGWTPRIHEVSGISKDELPEIHGKLIAYGFLKFDLAGRDGGIRYQLTPLGKLGINASNSSDLDDSALQNAEHDELAASHS